MAPKPECGITHTWGNSSYVSGERNSDKNILVINRSFVYRNAELENKRGTCGDWQLSFTTRQPACKTYKKERNRISGFHKTLSGLLFYDTHYSI